MPIDSRVYLDTPSQVSTEAPGKVGEVRSHLHSTYGFQMYRLVLAGAAITANRVVEWQAGATGAAIMVDANFVPAVMIAGVAQNAIASGSYGWVCCSGTCLVKTNASVTALGIATTKGASAAGEVDDTDFGDVEESIIGMFPSVIGSATTGAIRLSGLL